MKNYIFILFIVVLHSFALAQKNRVYFDNNWKEIKSVKGASFYREVAQTSDSSLSGYKVSDFFINGSIQMEGYCLDKACDVKHGEFTYYYENSNIHQTGSFKNDVEIGEWIEYYPNSEKKKKGNYIKVNDSTSRYVHLDFWDSTGVQLLKDGNGRYIHLLENAQNEVYKEGQMINSKREGGCTSSI